MTAFPSNSSNISTANLDSGSDKPADAREDLRKALVEVSTIIDSFGDASGICPLDSSGLVDSSRLTGVVNTTELADNAVETAKINDGAVTNAKLAGSITSAKLANFVTTVDTNSTATQIPSASAVFNSVTNNTSIIGSFRPSWNASSALSYLGTGTQTYTYKTIDFTPASADSKYIVFNAGKGQTTYKNYEEYSPDPTTSAKAYFERNQTTDITLSTGTTVTIPIGFVWSPNTTSAVDIKIQTNRTTNHLTANRIGHKKDYVIGAGYLYIIEVINPDVTFTIS